MRRALVAIVITLLVGTLMPARITATTLAREWGLGGNEPFGVTIDPRSGVAYVAISDRNNWYGPGYMWYIDPSLANPFVSPTDPTVVVLPRIPLPRAQTMSVLDVALDRLFVTTNEGLAIVDVSAKTLVARVPLAYAGAGLDLDPATHRVYVATVNGAAIVDGSTGAVVREVSAPSINDAWFDIVHDPGGHRVFVTDANFAGGPARLVVLSDTDLADVTSIPLPAMPRLGLAFDETRARVYVSGFTAGSELPGKVYSIDATTLQVVGAVDVGHGLGVPFTLTLDSDRLFVSIIGNADGRSENAVATVDLVSFTEIERVPVPFNPGQTALGRDGRLYVADFNHARLVALELGNHAPILRSLTFFPAAPTTTDRLQIGVDALDPDLGPGGYPPFPASVTYEWSRNGAPLPGATTDTLDLSLAGNGDRGDTIAVRVTVSDGEFSASQTRSVLIGNARPTLRVSLDPISPRTNDVLHASVETTDADGDAVGVTYTWSRNGAVIPGVTTASLDLASFGDHFDTIAVTASASDGHGGSATASASTTVADTAPVAAIELNTTTPGSWDPLMATAIVSDADGDALSYTWYLKRKGTLVRAATGPQVGFSLFDEGVGDRGDVLTVELLVGDGTLNVTTTATAVVVNSAPILTIFALSNGEPRRTDTLVLTVDSIDPDGDSRITYTYTWSVGKKVRRVTTTTASTDSLDLRTYSPGDLITVTVTATDGSDASIPATATARIAPR